MEKPTFRVIVDPSRKNHISLSLGENWLSVTIYTGSEPSDYFLLKAVNAVKLYTRDIHAKCNTEADAKYWLRAMSMATAAPSPSTSTTPSQSTSTVKQEVKSTVSFEGFDVDSMVKTVLTMMKQRGGAPHFSSELPRDVFKSHNYIKSVTASPLAPVYVLEAVRKEVVNQR